MAGMIWLLVPAQHIPEEATVGTHDEGDEAEQDGGKFDLIPIEYWSRWRLQH